MAIARTNIAGSYSGHMQSRGNRYLLCESCEDAVAGCTRRPSASCGYRPIYSLGEPGNHGSGKGGMSGIER